jgi:hypothetical protein
MDNMAIRREDKEEEKRKNVRVSKSDSDVADPPVSKKEPPVKDTATTVPESTSSNSVSKPSSVYPPDISTSGPDEAKSSSQQQKQQAQIVDRILEETKQNIRKATKEAREEFPRLTKAVNSFQDQNIQAAAEVVENYIEIQRQLISSIQTSWIPYLENTATLFWNSFLSPQRIVELYTNSVAGFADVGIFANRTINNYFLENMQTIRNNMEQANRISNDLASACMNFAKLETKQRKVIDTKSQVSEGEVTTVVETRSE